MPDPPPPPAGCSQVVDRHAPPLRAHSSWAVGTRPGAVHAVSTVASSRASLTIAVVGHFIRESQYRPVRPPGYGVSLGSHPKANGLRVRVPTNTLVAQMTAIASTSMR